MRPPRKIKEVQRLNGRIAALIRFMSKSADRCLPFFKAIKGKGFEWTQDCQLAFDELKSYLASVPTLARPKEGEVLELYLSASDEVVSSVLIKEVDRVQRPIYYVSKVLQGAETRYLQIEKLAYALVIAARKLCPYFQAHTVIVLNDKPLRQVLLKPEVSGWLTKWAIELSEYDLQYKPRTAIKAQALADFIAECTFSLEAPEPVEPEIPSSGELGAPKPNESEPREVAASVASLLVRPSANWDEEPWILHVDGSSNQ